MSSCPCGCGWATLTVHNSKSNIVEILWRSPEDQLEVLDKAIARMVKERAAIAAQDINYNTG